ncbi:MAG: VWA domain-containing protein [Sulfolobales archaeon]|nr:VWA domain-containing protein [Sulfolobales archaeon]MCX8198822.1 VWA domain-containing protein [Sulfolobales archaeon]MDW8170780.1 vWA domain-containing protein [Desulfurococcaceae archaeon]
MSSVTYVVDASLSMKKAFGELALSKIDVVRETLIQVVPKVVEKNNYYIGLVVFYKQAFPLLAPTRDVRNIVNAFSRIRVLGEGSAPGNGLIEAVKVMRWNRGSKRVVMITDGGFNEGVPLDIAAIYAGSSSVKLHIIVIGGKLTDVDAVYIDRAIEICNGGKYVVSDKVQLVQAIYKATLS